MELFILYFKGLLVRISIKLCILVPEAESRLFLSYAAFHLGLHGLPKYLFLPVSRMLRVKFPKSCIPKEDEWDIFFF